MGAPKRPIPANYPEIIAELREVRDALRDGERRREMLIRAAAGHAAASAAAIGRAAGITPQRVSQIAPLRAAKSAAAAAADTQPKTVRRTAAQPQSDALPAQSDAPAAEPAAEPAPEPAPQPDPQPAPPAAAPQPQPELREQPRLADSDFYVTDVQSTTLTYRQKAMRTLIADASGAALWRGQPVKLDVGRGTVGEWLTAIQSLDAEAGASGGPERVYICGPAPWHVGYEEGSGGPQKKDLVLAWLYAPLPHPWRPHKKGHWSHADDPAGRYSLSKTRHVEIRGVEEWFGTSMVDYRDVRAAFWMVREDIRAAFGEGAEFLGGPASLGKDLWQRSIPAKAEYPVLSDEMRGLIKDTSGSGRSEMFTNVPETLPGLYAYDATFAYAALANGLGVGNPTRITAQKWESADEKARTKMLYARGRWEVEVTVPRVWDGPGLLQAKAGRDWTYPSTPGQKWRTWVGGAEVALALREGWGIRVLDGWTQDEAKPMTVWRDALVKLWQGYRSIAEHSTDDAQRRAAKLAGKAVRAVVLTTIGSMGTHTRKMPTAVRITGPDAQTPPPGDWKPHPTDPGLIIVQRTIPASPTATSHPEWWADIVSRQRARLLSGPGPIKGQPTGALHMRGGHLVAFRTDAVYTTVPQTWANPNHQPGLLRPKGALPFTVRRPGTVGELLDYAKAMEDDYAAGGTA